MHNTTPSTRQFVADIQSRDVDRRRQAVLTAVAAGRSYTDAGDVMDHLLAALDDDDAMVRASGAVALGQLGEVHPGKLDAAAAEARLCTLLADPDDTVRRSAAIALGLLKRQATVPALIAALKAELDDPALWHFIVGALNRIATPEARQAIGAVKPSIIKFADSANVTIRAMAINTLGDIGADESAPHLAELLGLTGDEHSAIRIAAAQALEKFAGAAKFALPALHQALKREGPKGDQGVRTAVKQAIATIERG